MNIPDRGALAAPDFKPAPEEISLRGHFWGAFGHHETEVSARWLCDLARSSGGWHPFTPESVRRFYRGRDGFTFNRLIEPGVGYGRPGERYRTGGGWIVERDGLLHFTEEFVMRCYLSSAGSSELRERFPEEGERREYF
jgi:hypothetical protein